jgi:hypothetical protein
MKKIEKKLDEKIADIGAKKMTRKEAIRKSGLMAVTAATTLILLSSPNKAQAASPGPVIPGGF